MSQKSLPNKPAYTYRAMVRRVIDGDTVEVDVDLGLGVWKTGEKLRLLGINAPEMIGPTHDRGVASRLFLSQLIEKLGQPDDDGVEIVIQTHKDKDDKYGRLLATLIGFEGDAPVDINEAMFDAGMAERMKC